MEKHTRLNITLPQTIADELNLLAEEMHDKKSRIITKALELYFDEVDTAIAERRLDEISKGHGSPISADQVWKDLGL